MLNKKTFSAILSLTLVGSMMTPAFAADIPTPQLNSGAKPVISEYTSVISDCTPVTADQNPLTRAELVTVLYEKEGKPGVDFAMDYTDVAADAEYAEAIRWASSEGIASGYGYPEGATPAHILWQFGMTEPILIPSNLWRYKLPWTRKAAVVFPHRFSTP